MGNNLGIAGPPAVRNSRRGSVRPGGNTLGADLGGHKSVATIRNSVRKSGMAPAGGGGGLAVGPPPQIRNSRMVQAADQNEAANDELLALR